MTMMIFAAILLGAGAAGAQTAAPQAGTVGPSRIPGETREQKLAAIDNLLKDMDVNQDDVITEMEWTSAGGRAAGFEALDGNRDDRLTRQEIRSNARKLKAFEDIEAAAPF